MLCRSCVQVDRGACAQGLNNADTCRRGNLGQVWGEASVIPRRDQSLGCAWLDALNTRAIGRSCGENMTLWCGIATPAHRQEIRYVAGHAAKT